MPITLSDEHLEHLATTRQQGVERLSRLIGQRPGLRTHALGEQRQGFSIDLIRLRELASGPSEVPRLTGIGHHHRHLGRSEGGHRRTLVPPGGFQYDQRRVMPAQLLDKFLDTRLIIVDRPALT
jgi:hypothetical protein